MFLVAQEFCLSTALLESFLVVGGLLAIYKEFVILLIRFYFLIKFCFAHLMFDRSFRKLT